MKELVIKVLEAFDELRTQCPHASYDEDCHHPDLDFSCMSCGPWNCPLILEER